MSEGNPWHMCCCVNFPGSTSPEPLLQRLVTDASQPSRTSGGGSSALRVKGPAGKRLPWLRSAAMPTTLSGMSAALTWLPCAVPGVGERLGVQGAPRHMLTPTGQAPAPRSGSKVSSGQQRPGKQTRGPAQVADALVGGKPWESRL